MVLNNVRIFRVLLAGLTAFCATTALAQFDDGARYGFLASKSASTVTIVDLQQRSNAHTIQLADAPDSVAASQALRALIIGHTLM